MMKAKRPGVLFEHLAKAVRSEGPVHIFLSSSEALSSSSSSLQSMPTFGIQVKRKKLQLLPKLKPRKSKTKLMTRQLETLYGSTDSMLQQDQFDQSRTS